MARKLKRDQVERTYANTGSLRAIDLPYDADDSIKTALDSRTPPDIVSADDGKLSQAYYEAPPVYGDESEGNVTISTETQINSYTDLTADVTAGSSTINVRDVSPGTETPFAAGDEACIIQTQCYRDETKRFQYEFKTIDSVDGGANTITFTTPLSNSYDSDPGGNAVQMTKAQVIRVPHYNTLTLNANIIPKGWDGYSGGYLIYRAKTLTGTGLHDVRDRGFRGYYVNFKETTPFPRTWVNEGPLGKGGFWLTDHPTAVNENLCAIYNATSPGNGQGGTFGFNGFDGNTPGTKYMSTGYTVGGSAFTTDDFATQLPLMIGWASFVRSTFISTNVFNMDDNSPGTAMCFVQSMSGYTGTFEAQGVRTNQSGNAGGYGEGDVPGGYVAIYSETAYSLGNVDVTDANAVSPYANDGLKTVATPTASVNKGYQHGPNVATTDAGSAAGDVLTRDALDERYAGLTNATLNADTSLVGNGYFLDEDNMASDDATKVASQQSIKAYVDVQNTTDTWQRKVLAKQTTPPGSPTTGDRYLIEATATGAWVGQEDKIAEWDGSSWLFTSPFEGMRVPNVATTTIWQYQAAAWNETTPVNRTDGSLVGVTWFLDEDTMASDDPTKVPSQQSVKAYVDGLVAAAIILQGDWNASTNTPDITGTTTTGHAWRVSAAGSTDLGGITDWAVGDMAIKTATGWLKIDNEDISAVWGNITGTLSNQTDLQSALDAKNDAPSEGAFVDGDKTKLDGIEAGADVTDATNVDAAGATMNADTDVSANGWVVDEDDMTSDLATKVPTQQSVRAYHDNFRVQQKIGSYTLAAGDNGSYIRMYNLFNSLITIPLESSVNFPIGAWVEVSWEAPGSVGITAPVGVTLNNNSAAPTIYLGARYDSARLVKVASDEWTVTVSGFKSDITIPSYTPTGTTQAIDWSEGAKQIVDLGSATGDVTLTFDNLTVSRDYYLKFIQGATARSVILPSEIKIPGHTSPVTLTLTPTDDDEDVFQFYWANTEGYGELLGRTALDYDTDVSGKSWVLDEDTMTSDDATKVPTQQSVKAYVDANSSTPYQEFHTVTAGEVTAGYFTLTNNPEAAQSVLVFALDSTMQLNKQSIGIGSETPDFDVLSTNQVHINNNGAATGLSESIIAGDKLIISYRG